MRLIAPLLLSGLFSTMAVLPSCLARETPSGDAPPLPEGTVVPYIDPLQACLDACFLGSKLCGSAGDGCMSFCGDEFRLAGPECQDDFGMHYACEFAEYQVIAASNMPECPPYPLCNRTPFRDCVVTYGCTWAASGPDAPGSDACLSIEYCLQSEYESFCRPNGMTTTCDCHVDGVLVGTCDGGTDLFCDKNLTKGCCNEYFKLEF
jgi:hypothetical protein